MERTSVNLETLKDVPGYRVILKTVLQSQIQQLVEQLSKHTEEEAVFLTASLGDGTISHIGSGVGKEFLQENDEVKSKFLAFCLKRHHEISTNKQSKLPKSQDQGPVPLKITGSSIGSSHRHSPYSTSFSKRRNSQRQPPKTPSDQSHNDLNETVIKENDRKILESVSIELAQDYENENVDEYDVTDNEGLSDDLEESDQKSNKIIIKNVTGHYEPNTHADTMGNNNLDAFIPTSNVKDEHVHTSESSAQINAGSGLQFGVCKDISSGVGPAGPSASAATGVYTDLQDDVTGHEDGHFHDAVCIKREIFDEKLCADDGTEYTHSNQECPGYFHSEGERHSAQYTAEEMLEKRELRGRTIKAEGERHSAQYTAEEMLEKREVRGRTTKAQLFFSSLIREAAILAQIWKTAPTLSHISANQKECFLNAVCKTAPQLSCLRKEVWQRLGLNLQNRRKYLQDKNAGKRSTKTTKTSNSLNFSDNDVVS
ncbi:uncharacterized protein LOC123539664 isoform X4 [Mercenaria mercenaria]|uniref:uncharacterized protein LOC123539664 isoform X4 n=1 Tax=Mercenaria mercenaria TaxID=6596 RepID=UPI00234E951B|nr:uncharacterized protein LOC123539664 isoform X4 [Mercenaria mercenaria]